MFASSDRHISPFFYFVGHFSGSYVIIGKQVCQACSCGVTYTSERHSNENKGITSSERKTVMTENCSRKELWESIAGDQRGRRDLSARADCLWGPEGWIFVVRAPEASSAPFVRRVAVSTLRRGGDTMEET